MKPTLTIPVGLAILLLCLTVFTSPAQARSAPWDIEKLPATPAPAFSLPDIEGKTLSSAAFKDQLLLINFWATWCAPCREEMPALDRLQQKYKQKGLTVIGIAIDSDQTVVKQFLNTAKIHFPILHDPTMTTHDTYKVFSYPTTFLVDRKGIIRQYWLGSQEWDGEEFGKIIQGYLH
jgi:peroxiredoxin